MIIARPTVEQERGLALADRYPALRAVVEKADSTGGWKTTTWLGRGLGFLLGLLATSLLGGVLSPLGSPLIVGGVALVVVAEWLVAQRRVYRSGIEEAVYLCGAVGVVVQLLIWSDGNNEAAGVALVATTVLLVGWRLLNPVFTTLAAAGYSLAIAFVDTHLFAGNLNLRAASIACAVLALAALAAGSRQWRRPSHDQMCDGLVIVMPWLAYGWLIAYGWRGSALVTWTALGLALGFFVVNLFAGVKRRQHAPLIGALGNLVCVAYSLHELIHWPMHWKLILAGAILLAAAWALERLLRDRLEGTTSQAVDEPEGLDLMQLAGAVQIAPAPGPEPQPGVHGQGGEFGGGGASGRF
jgi:hypothetical protein